MNEWHKITPKSNERLKDGPQFILCTTWPRRPAGYNNSNPIPHIKAVPDRFDVWNYDAIVVTSWPARQVAHKSTEDRP